MPRVIADLVTSGDLAGGFGSIGDVACASVWSVRPRVRCAGSGDRRSRGWSAVGIQSMTPLIVAANGWSVLFRDPGGDSWAVRTVR